MFFRSTASAMASASVPALLTFGNPHSLGIWVDDNIDPSVRAAAKAYSSSLAILTERQEKAVKN
jgi:hypothetical protein